MNQVEFIRNARTFSMPYGMYAALITERIEVDALVQKNQTQNIGLYQRIDLTAQPVRAYFDFQTIQDYFVHVQFVNISYPDTPTIDLTVNMGFESRNRDLNTPRPVDFRILSNPGKLQPRSKHTVDINLTIAPEDILVFTVNGQTGGQPTHLDFLLTALRIPRQVLTDW